MYCALGLEHIERMREKRLARFAGIALTLVRVVESPADLVGLRREPSMKRHVPDHLSAYFLDDGESFALVAGML
jgi:hypothetical protein